MYLIIRNLQSYLRTLKTGLGKSKNLKLMTLPMVRKSYCQHLILEKTCSCWKNFFILGLCTQYDLSLWNDALAMAAGRVEQEQGEGLGLRSVAMGRWEMSCWCASPYPEPLCQCRRLFICEFCLKPVQSGTVLRRHCAKCVWRHPPGDEIYRLGFLQRELLQKIL